MPGLCAEIVAHVFVQGPGHMIFSTSSESDVHLPLVPSAISSRDPYITSHIASLSAGNFASSLHLLYLIGLSLCPLPL